MTGQLTAGGAARIKVVSARSTFPRGWMWGAVSLFSGAAIAYIGIPNESRLAYGLGLVTLLLASVARLTYEWARNHKKEATEAHPSYLVLLKVSRGSAIIGVLFLFATLFVAFGGDVTIRQTIHSSWEIGAERGDPALTSSQVTVEIQTHSNSDPDSTIGFANAGPGIAQHLRFWGILRLATDIGDWEFPNESIPVSDVEHDILPGEAITTTFGNLMKNIRPNAPVRGPYSSLYMYFLYVSPAGNVVEHDSVFTYDNDVKFWEGRSPSVFLQRDRLLALARAKCGFDEMRRATQGSSR